MSDASLYYKIKLLDPAGTEISKKVYRIYPQEETGEKQADMRGVILGMELARDAWAHANSPDEYLARKAKRDEERAKIIAQARPLRELYQRFFKQATCPKS